jgi:hypothetical protein
LALTGGLASSALTPNVLAARLGEVGAAFEFYKFTKIRYRILCDTATSEPEADLALGYYPEEPNSSVTHAEVQEFTPCAHFADSNTGIVLQSVPSDWKRIPDSILNSTPSRMYQVNSANPEDPFLVQGTFVAASNNPGDTGTVCYEVEYTCVFKGISVMSL